jgi:hypothetical protein
MSLILQKYSLKATLKFSVLLLEIANPYISLQELCLLVKLLQ